MAFEYEIIYLHGDAYTFDALLDSTGAPTFNPLSLTIEFDVQRDVQALVLISADIPDAFNGYRLMFNNDPTTSFTVAPSNFHSLPDTSTNVVTNVASIPNSQNCRYVQLGRFDSSGT